VIFIGTALATGVLAPRAARRAGAQAAATATADAQVRS
jgi:hypothetical protein